MRNERSDTQAKTARFLVATSGMGREVLLILPIVSDASGRM